MRVLVAMSGGVDSSAAAALLVDEGHDVTGVHLKMAHVDGTPPGRGCCTLDDARDAARVADHLGIPFYVWDLTDAFRERVVDDFVAEYAAGRTPNPCIRCNERVKYAALLERARAVGFDALATGHHVRVRERGGRWVLLRAVDPQKDQTYVLYGATQDQLAHTRWPAGELRKEELRAYAAARGLATAAKPDSSDVCFVPSGDLGGFLRARLPVRPGPFVDPRGVEIGAHDGAYRFTVGQRRGLGVAGRAEPLYVTAIEGDVVHVGPRSALGVRRLRVHGCSWVADAPPAAPGAAAEVGLQVRSTARPVPAVLLVDGDEAEIAVRGDPVEGVAPGQAAVCYLDDECLGGGTVVATSA